MPILIQNIIQGPVFDDKILTMTSMYEITHFKEKHDALGSLSNFSTSVIQLILKFVLIIGLVIYLSHSFKLYMIFHRNKRSKKRLKRIINMIFLMFNNLIKFTMHFPRYLSWVLHTTSCFQSLCNHFD